MICHRSKRRQGASPPLLNDYEISIQQWSCSDHVIAGIGRKRLDEKWTRDGCRNERSVRTSAGTLGTQATKLQNLDIPWKWKLVLFFLVCFCVFVCVRMSFCLSVCLHHTGTSHTYSHSHPQWIKEGLDFVWPSPDLHCHGDRCSGHSTNQEGRNIPTMSKVQWINPSLIIFALFFSVQTLPFNTVDNTLLLYVSHDTCCFETVVLPE